MNGERASELGRRLSRRAFLGGSGLSVGALALGALASAEGTAANAPTRRARAKSVIYLHMSGAPPQQDLFDPKPELQALDRRPCPDSMLAGRRFAFIQGHPVLLGAPHGFRRMGASGREVCALMPHFEAIADDVCLVRSLHTDQFNHAPAELLLFTGSPQFGGASLGSWAMYGLGSVNRDLPGFVVMLSGDSDPTGGKSLWGAGFLPAHYQGTLLRSQGDPVLDVADPAGMDRPLRRRSLDALARLNRLAHAEHGDPETTSRIEQYELAFRMQAAVPEVADLSDEPAEVLALYGCTPHERSFARNCLLARRLIERGVRFVQLFDWGWDIHGTGPHDDLLTMFPRKCRETDRAVAGLVVDLKRRGLLDETLVVWGGEFGRTPMNEARNGSTYLGRDHHPDCFSLWLAGAGVRAGFTYGATDELGYSIASDPVSVRDLQATLLHLLGLDPERLSVFDRGLRQRLIGPAEGPRVVHELLS